MVSKRVKVVHLKCVPEQKRGNCRAREKLATFSPITLYYILPPTFSYIGDVNLGYPHFDKSLKIHYFCHLPEILNCVKWFTKSPKTRKCLLKGAPFHFYVYEANLLKLNWSFFFGLFGNHLIQFKITGGNFLKNGTP